MKTSALLLKALSRFLFDYRQPADCASIQAPRFKRIAIIKVDGIGDFVLATTFLNALAELYSEADVTVVCRAPTAELARWQYPKWKVETILPKVRPFREILSSASIRRRLRAMPEFDVLIDLRGYRDAADGAISSWVPARQKLGIRNALSGDYQWAALPDEERAFNRLLERPKNMRNTCEDIACHRVLANGILGVDANRLLPALRVTQSEIEALRLKAGIPPGPILAVCPGTSIPEKEYPPEALARAIMDAKLPSDLQIILAGGTGDARTILPLSHFLSGFRPITDLSGKLTIAENAVLLAAADCVIAMDSCHAHISGAVGTPALILLSGRHRGFFGPWNPSPTFRWLFSSTPQTTSSMPFIYDEPLTIDTLTIDTVSAEISSIAKIAFSGTSGFKS